MRRALLLAATDPLIGGVLIFGDRGTGKSTAVRGLAALLPPIRATVGCPYRCDPDRPSPICPFCSGAHAPAKRKAETVPPPVVDLPLGATEDRVVGALDLERALTRGETAFQPGLLARANRGFLYIDEANLLEDHLVDLLLDAAASGENVVEREGLSVRHPARFVLVGSGNPEEGELRPQLLDRFGLSVDVETPREIEQRIEVIRRRDSFERHPEKFLAQWAPQDAVLRRKIVAARKALTDIVVDDAILRRAAQLCLTLGADGLRGELTLVRAARAAAAFEGRRAVADEDVRGVALSALRHRLRRNVLDETRAGARVERAVAEVFGAV